jgi:beta-lactamase superfamily II metal-dependent hydrolase
MGDAETLSENEILSKGYDVKSDFLKVGHHGSSTSTSDKFLKAVNPSYAVISVGKNNTYNLPKKSVMDRLKKYNISVYRTDEQGNITLTSDGNTINFDKQKASYSYMK